MDILQDKQYKEYDYLSRYTTFPYYYNKVDDKYMYGIVGHLKEDTAYVLHEVKDFDTLDSLSFKYYGRPDFYWIIADFNRIRDPFMRLKDKYSAVKVPSISTIMFED